MCLKKNAFLKTLLLFFVLFVLAACAPKKVRLYGVPDMLRSNVILSALQLQGKPYKNGARGPEAFDCSGLVYYVFKQHRISLPPPAQLQGRAGREIGREHVQPADLVLFKVDKDFHVGIVVSRNEFIHASSSRGVTVDNMDSDYWRRYLLGYRSVF